MSNLIKRNYLTISEPMLLTVEPPPVLSEDLMDAEINAGTFDEVSNFASKPSNMEEEDFLASKIIKLKAELKAVQTEIDQKLETSRLEAEAIIIEAEEECRLLMEKASQEIESMKAQTLEECIAIQTEAYEKAYQDGIRQAREENENERQLALAQTKQILEEAEVKRKEIIHTAEPAIVDLAMAVAKKVVAIELNSRPELIIDIVKEAIDHLDNPQNVRVQVNPKDELHLSGQGQYLTSSQFGNVTLTISPDESIERGGSIVESNMAVVDSRLGIRINNIQNMLNEVLINEGSV